MSATKAKPHAGERGASRHASAPESVGGSNDTPLPRSGNPAGARPSPRAVLRERRQRQRAKGRMHSGGYLALPHALLNSPNYRGLSACAVKLLNDLGFQYRGSNNGDLCAAWRVMHARGWKSRDTLCRALAELRHTGMIEMTRQGGKNRCSLFALTWLAIDECGGKLDCAATRVSSGLWKEPKPPMPNRLGRKQNADTAGVSIRHGRRDSEDHAVH